MVNGEFTHCAGRDMKAYFHDGKIGTGVNVRGLEDQEGGVHVQ